VERAVKEDLILGGLTILFTGMAVLVPVLGLTLRFAIKPFFDTWAEIQRNRVSGDQSELLARQVSLLELELQEVQRTLQSVTDGQDFQRRLADPSLRELASRDSAPS
jgi:hypothetical protein